MTPTRLFAVPGGAPPPRALLVEADATLRRALTTLLQAEGYEVTAVDTVFGTHALVRLLAPAVVLLDLELPYRSGLSLLPHLQADPQTAPIPVVVLTTLPALPPPARRPLATAVLTPPVSAPALHAALQTARSAWLMGQARDGQARAQSTIAAAREAVAHAQARPAGDLARIVRTTRRLRAAPLRVAKDVSA